MRKAIGILLLTVALASAALAGDMPIGGGSPSSPGDMPNGAPATATKIALDLATGLLSLL
jgi:hypothetical protein